MTLKPLAALILSFPLELNVVSAKETHTAAATTSAERYAHAS